MGLRKAFLIVAACALAALGLSACGGGGIVILIVIVAAILLIRFWPAIVRWWEDR